MKCNWPFTNVALVSKIEVPRDVRNSKSGIMTGSGETGLNITKKCESQMGQDQVSGAEIVLCWQAAPVAMFY